MKKRYIAMLKLEGLHSQVGVDVGVSVAKRGRGIEHAERINPRINRMSRNVLFLM